MCKIIITKTYQELSEKAAGAVIFQIKQKPNSVFCLPADRTSLGTYKKLTEAYRDGKISFSKITIFNLDEYIGLPANNPLSYHFHMKKHLFSKIDIDPKKVFIPNGFTRNLEKECRNYDEKIKKYGPVDLCILGIGINGHIAFNEPGTNPSLPTHITKLAKKTIETNKGPSSAITIGISTILKSKKIILLVSGEEKARAIYHAIKNPISKNRPASFLQKHNNVQFIIDREAAIMLNSK